MSIISLGYRPKERNVRHSSQYNSSTIDHQGGGELDIDAVIRQAAAAVMARLGQEPGASVGQPIEQAIGDPTSYNPSVITRLREKRWMGSAQGLQGVSVTSEQGSPAATIEKFWSPKTKSIARRIGTGLTYAFAAWFTFVFVLIVAYRFVNPPASNLMIYTYLTGRKVTHTWTPLGKISPAVIKAVVVAEDARFCQHWGIDFVAIKDAVVNARDWTPRGASTISMQTAKNMFLWQSKSYVRKVLEVPVTIMMELIWPKKRILEIYLNIAEWGPGVFGIGAAARHHFKTTPVKLGSAAASQLAAALPNPKVRRAGRPGPKTRRKAHVIRGRARHAGYYTGCILP